MILKLRKIPVHLQLRRYLKPRMSFTDGELKKLQADEKGFEGECQFDELINQSPVSTFLQLNDLLLEWRNTTFQIDSLLISPYKIYLFDTKNFEGEFYIEGNRWYLSSGYEIKNPIPQIQRSESLLRPLVQTLGINLPIKARNQVPALNLLTYLNISTLCDHPKILFHRNVSQKWGWGSPVCSLLSWAKSTATPRYL